MRGCAAGHLGLLIFPAMRTWKRASARGSYIGDKYAQEPNNRQIQSWFLVLFDPCAQQRVLRALCEEE